MSYYRLTLFFLALVGLLVSSYLFYVYTQGGPIKCYGGHGCDVVRASSYAQFFGVPTPAYGVVFYSLLAVGALLIDTKISPWLQLSLRILTGAGLAVTVYLTYLEAFVIEAWCGWCIVSAAAATLAFLLVWAGRRADLPGDTSIG